MLSDGKPSPRHGLQCGDVGRELAACRVGTAHVHGHVADGAELPPAVFAGVHGLFRPLVQDVALGTAFVAAARQEVTRVAECHSAADTVIGHRLRHLLLIL